MGYNNFHDCRTKKYNTIRIAYERAYMDKNYLSKLHIYDVEKNRILFRTVDGENFWMPMEIYLKMASWPLATTGHTPDPLKYCEYISIEELDEIYENTVEWEDEHFQPLVDIKDIIDKYESQSLPPYDEKLKVISFEEAKKYYDI